MNPLEFILGKKAPKPAELVEVTVNALREIEQAPDPKACTKVHAHRASGGGPPCGAAAARARDAVVGN